NSQRRRQRPSRRRQHYSIITKKTSSKSVEARAEKGMSSKTSTHGVSGRS
ncbi:hypothetical protein E5Q_06382, partial [Mixia osmundae IAM 14324]